MHADLRQKAIELRIKERLSYGAILKRLPVAKSTLSSWLKDLPLSETEILELRRKGWQKGEVSRERFRATMRGKREAKAQGVYKQQRTRFVDISTDAYFVAGLMLYLAEGAKSESYTIALTNTDPRIIKFFIGWMDQFLGVVKENLKAALHLYENMDIRKEEEFWLKETGFEKGQFYKTQIRKLQKGSFSYAESFRHGTCRVIFNSVEKKRELMMGIRAFLDSYQERSGV